MYSNVQSLILVREGENIPTNWWDLVYKTMVEILNAISDKLTGQYVTVYNLI